MSRFTPAPAKRTGSKARLALSGPSGAGKTWTALECATILAVPGKVLVLDTERGSAALYSDYYEFDEIAWTPPYDPRELAQVLAEHGSGYGCIVVDSLSHFWEAEGGTRDIVDAAASRARGNSFAGWKEGTPAQNDMVAGLLRCEAHVIVTMRSKTEYVLQPDRNGKQVPKRIGMQPIQRQGIEYEFTVTADLDHEHTLLVDKTRCHPLAGRMFKAGHAAEMAETLRGWLDSAEPAPPDPDDLRWQALDDEFDGLDDAKRLRLVESGSRAAKHQVQRPSDARDGGEAAYDWWRKYLDRAAAADPEPERAPEMPHHPVDPDGAVTAREVAIGWTDALHDITGKGSTARRDAIRHAAAAYVTGDPGRWHSADLTGEELLASYNLAGEVAEDRVTVELDESTDPWTVAFTDDDGNTARVVLPVEREQAP